MMKRETLEGGKCEKGLVCFLLGVGRSCRLFVGRGRETSCIYILLSLPPSVLNSTQVQTKSLNSRENQSTRNSCPPHSCPVTSLYIPSTPCLPYNKLWPEPSQCWLGHGKDIGAITLPPAQSGQVDLEPPIFQATLLRQLHFSGLSKARNTYRIGLKGRDRPQRTKRGLNLWIERGSGCWEEEQWELLKSMWAFASDAPL